MNNKTLEKKAYSLNFSNRLRALKKESNLTYSDISQATGISESAIKLYCNDKSDVQKRLPSFENIIILAKYFKVTTDYLLGMSDYRDFLEELVISYDKYGNDYKKYTDKYFLYLDAKEELDEEIEEKFVRSFFHKINIRYIKGISIEEIQRDTMLMIYEYLIEALSPLIKVIDLDKVIGDDTLETLMFEQESKEKK